MPKFAVVYQFLCPNCNHIAVDEKVLDADGPIEASHLLATLELPCVVCHQTVCVQTQARTFVFASSNQDDDSATGPALP